MYINRLYADTKWHNHKPSELQKKSTMLSSLVYQPTALNLLQQTIFCWFLQFLSKAVGRDKPEYNIRWLYHFKDKKYQNFQQIYIAGKDANSVYNFSFFSLSRRKFTFHKRFIFPPNFVGLHFFIQSELFPLLIFL